jgi:hypothetical protein
MPQIKKGGRERAKSASETKELLAARKQQVLGIAAEREAASMVTRLLNVF